MFKLTILCLLFLLHAFATPLAPRDVADPPITNPTAKTVWTSGQTVKVTWDTSVLPPPGKITNPIGLLLLGHLGPTGGENLDIDHPLGENITLTDGSISIKVPSVPTRNDYILVLMGSSGNASPKFTIKGTGTTGANDQVSKSSTLITTPIPITGSVITGGSSDSQTAAPTGGNSTGAITPLPSQTGSLPPSPSNTSTVPTPAPGGASQMLALPKALIVAGVVLALSL